MKQGLTHFNVQFKVVSTGFRDKEGFVIRDIRYLLPEEAFYLSSQGKIRFVANISSLDDSLPRTVPAVTLLQKVFGFQDKATIDPYLQHFIIAGFSFLRKNASLVSR